MSNNTHVPSKTPLPTTTPYSSLPQLIDTADNLLALSFATDRDPTALLEQADTLIAARQAMSYPPMRTQHDSRGEFDWDGFIETMREGVSGRRPNVRVFESGVVRENRLHKSEVPGMKGEALRSGKAQSLPDLNVGMNQAMPQTASLDNIGADHETTCTASSWQQANIKAEEAVWRSCPPFSGTAERASFVDTHVHASDAEDEGSDEWVSEDSKDGDDKGDDRPGR
jgi:hypothetical protein